MKKGLILFAVLGLLTVAGTSTSLQAVDFDSGPGPMGVTKVASFDPGPGPMGVTVLLADFSPGPGPMSVTKG